MRLVIKIGNKKNMYSITESDIADVVIIGGGFSGLITLHHLAKTGSTDNIYIVIEPNENLGYGLAYGTKNPRHLLNVPARNMSALPDQPDHLIKWLLSENGRKASATLGIDRLWHGGDYVPRCLYARYLGDIALETYSIAKSRGIRLSHLRHKVIDVERSSAEGLYNLELDNGRSIQGSAIILATGNLPNDTGKASDILTDPWRGDWSLPHNGVEAVGIIGAGLTTVDTVLSLRGAGFTGKILAASRHGLLPKVHNNTPEVYKGSLSLPAATPEKILPLMQLFRTEIKNCLSNKISWQGVFDRWRPHTSPIWRKLSTRDRRRFFDRLFTLWGIHRHRMAPEIGAFIDKEISGGGLRILKGSAQAISTPEGLYLTVGNERHAVKKIFDCRGPCQDISRSGNRLILNLYNKGLIQRHETGWGLKISGDLQVLPHGADGSFLAVGPALVGEHLETIAVPELRQQAQKAASTVRIIGRNN